VKTHRAHGTHIAARMPHAARLARLAHMAGLVGVFGLVLLAGCDRTIRQHVDTGLEGGTKRAAQHQARLDAARRGAIIDEALPWYGRQVEARPASRRGKPLPHKFEGAKGFSLAIKGKSDIRTIADAIEAASDIPVSVRTRYIRPDGTVIAVPIATRMAAQYEGPLSAFLDRMAARMDIAWAYDGRSIAIDRMTTREWKVPLPRGKARFDDTVSDTIGDNGGTSIKTDYELDPWAELEERLKPLAPEPAHITISRTAGRVQVFGPPSVQRTVARVLDDVVATASRRIALEVAVFFVDSEKTDAFGASLRELNVRFGSGGAQAVAAATGAGAQANNAALPGGTLRIANNGRATLGVRTAGGIGGTVSFEALAKNSAVVDYRIGSTTVQSGVIAPISLTRTQSYNRRARTTTSDNGQATGGQETREFKTGIIIATLPRLIEKNRLQLGLAITQRDLVRIDDNAFPVIDERTIRSEAVLFAGETLVVSGYEQQRFAHDETGHGIFRKIGLGGRNAGEQRRVRMYVLIRPSVLAARRRP